MESCPVLVICATVVGLAPPEPITTPPVPALVLPFRLIAPVPAELRLVCWLVPTLP